MRLDGRKENALREIRITTGFMPNAEGSCLIEWGRTRVLVTATVQNTVPPFLLQSGKGWLTAEYAMLPGSTLTRKPRERQRADSRSIEIQRLIGRSLRSVLDLHALDGLTITIDADVIQADGGTRTASITGGFVALSLCVKKLLAEGRITQNPILHKLAAVSAGLVADTPLLDLCYQEDSQAQADMNYVGTEAGGISEIQIAGEQRPLAPEEFQALLTLCQDGVAALIRIQDQAING